MPEFQVANVAIWFAKDIQMKQVTIRRVGIHTHYLRIPPEIVHANNLEHDDLAYIMPIEGRPDKFEVTLVKAPVPQELQQEAAVEALG